MAFHKSNLGRFGESLPCDIDGYVPEAGDESHQFNVDLVDNDQYQYWHTEGGFEEWRDQAIEATSAAEEALNHWSEQNT